MASSITTVERLFASVRLGPRTFWDSLSDEDRRSSVNQRISRPFGRKRAWDVAGPVLEYWNDNLLGVVQWVCRENRRQIFAGVDWEGKFSLVCFMIGQTWTSTTPTVVIRIFDKAVIGRLGSRLRREERFRSSGFDIKGQQGELVFKAGQTSLPASQLDVVDTK